jgi:hypothetical protein
MDSTLHMREDNPDIASSGLKLGRCGFRDMMQFLMHYQKFITMFMIRKANNSCLLRSKLLQNLFGFWD